MFSGTLYPLIARCPPSTGWGVDGLSPDPRTTSLLTPTTPGRPGQTLSPSGSNGLSVRAEKGHARVGSEAELATVGGWGEGDACVEYIREAVLPAMGWGCRVVLLGYIFREHFSWVLSFDLRLSWPPPCEIPIVIDSAISLGRALVFVAFHFASGFPLVHRILPRPL